MNWSVSARLLVAATVASMVATVAACPSEVAAGCKGTTCDTGPVLPPRFYADPPFGIGFDCVVVGCEQDKHIVVENRGGGALMVSLARLSTDTSTDFTLRRADDGNLPNPDNQLTLAGGETVELVVTYVPSDGRPDEGAIVFEHYDGATPYIESTPRTDEIPVTTRSLGSAVATLSAGDVLDFGYVALGESKTLNIQVQNDGTDAVLRVGPTSVEESSADDGSPEVFAPPAPGAWGEDFANPAGIVEIPVTYTPVAAEASFGAVLVQTNDGAFPSLRVALMGTAIPTPRLAVIDPMSGTLALAGTRVGVERNGTITVQNLGGQPLDVAAAITAGAELGLSLLDPPSVTALVPLATASFTVHLQNDVGGAVAGQALLTSNDPDAPAGVPVPITGDVSAPLLSAAPAALQFGNIVMGWTGTPQQFAISNTGYGDLEVTAISLELGSSQQIQLIELPPLPQKLAPGAAPLLVTVLVVATSVGPADGVVLVTSDSISGDTGRVDIHARVVTCEEGCPTPNGTPDCSSGRCEVGSCVTRYHDADGSQPNGCECGEDVVGNVRQDIGQACSLGLNLGNISDNDSGYNFSATLHDIDDVDLFFFHAQDDTQFLNDDYGAQVSLLSAPPGLQICANFQQAGNGCGGSPTNCSATRVRGHGQSGIFGSSDNSEDVTVWLMWAQGANPVCGNYTFRYEADEDF